MMAMLPLLSACLFITNAEYNERLDDSQATCDSIFFADADEDGLGDPQEAVGGECERPDGFVNNADDCDDTDAKTGAFRTWYEDEDEDGYGTTETVEACEQPTQAAAESGDCNDIDPSINPGAIESCSTKDDDDCNGGFDAVDAIDCTDYYVDGDKDGYGAGTPTCRCIPRANEVDNPDDCDDLSNDISPDETEICDDGVDNDCDGTKDC